MADKDIAHEVIDALPDDASLDDAIHALYVRIKIERGMQDIREGRSVPHEEAMKRIQKWAK